MKAQEFVNRLYRSIQRQTRRKTRLVCFTDDGAGINPNVQIEPIPQIDLPKDLALTPWRKLAMWKFPLADLNGDVLFLDLAKALETPLASASRPKNTNIFTRIFKVILVLF